MGSAVAMLVLTPQWLLWYLVSRGGAASWLAVSLVRPARMPVIKADHSAGLNFSIGPATSLLSRTARYLPSRSETSTQAGFSPL